MKTTLLAILMVFVSMGLTAQDVTLQDANVSHFYPNTEDIPFDIAGHTTITNTTNADIEVRWTKVVNSISTGWSNTVCIGDLCYSPSTLTQTTTIPANGSIDLSYHGYPTGNTGTLNADVMITNEATGADYGNGHYEYEVEMSSGTSDILTNADVKLFPNPTNGFFKIETSFDLNHFEVYNVVGQMIERVQGMNSLDISSLPKGIYLVKAYDTDNRFKTVKLLKR